jgi:hypothetical protein
MKPKTDKTITRDSTGITKKKTVPLQLKVDF